MKPWDKRCDNIVDQLREYGRLEGDATARGDLGTAEQYTTKITEEIMRLNDYRGVPGPRSVWDALESMLKWLGDKLGEKLGH